MIDVCGGDISIRLGESMCDVCAFWERSDASLSNAEKRSAKTSRSTRGSVLARLFGNTTPATVLA